MALEKSAHTLYGQIAFENRTVQLVTLHVTLFYSPCSRKIQAYNLLLFKLFYLITNINSLLSLN